MKTTLMWMLVGLNVLLAAGVCFKYMKPNSAFAQVRRPGEYISIASSLPGQPAGVVYIVDTTTGDLSAISLDDNTNKVNIMPKIDLKSVFNQNAGTRGGR